VEDDDRGRQSGILRGNIKTFTADFCVQEIRINGKVIDYFHDALGEVLSDDRGDSGGDRLLAPPVAAAAKRRKRKRKRQEGKSDASPTAHANATPAASSPPCHSSGSGSGDESSERYTVGFTLQKDGMDTFEAVSTMAKWLDVGEACFTYAGLKDARAITVQDITLRLNPSESRCEEGLKLLAARYCASGKTEGQEDLDDVPTYPLFPAISDVRRVKRVLHRGESLGNRFTIKIRGLALDQADQDMSPVHTPATCGVCNERIRVDPELLNQLPELERASLVTMASCVASKTQGLRCGGFLNYYGLQRFGQTPFLNYETGRRILRHEYGDVVDLLIGQQSQLNPKASKGYVINSTIGAPYVLHAKAKEEWQRTKDPQIVSKLMPQTLEVEFKMLKYMAKEMRQGRGDDWEWLSERAVLGSVTWKRRLLYVYAYFSKIWNMFASLRIQEFGFEVVEGDLVLLRSTSTSNAVPKDQTITRTIIPQDQLTDDEQRNKTVKVVTKEDIHLKRYSMSDVVLPMPGSETVWPQNDIGRLYQQYLNYDGTGGKHAIPKTLIDETWVQLGKNSDEFYEYYHLRGDYRKVVQTVGDTFTASLFTYREKPKPQKPQTSEVIKAPRVFHDERTIHLCACSNPGKHAARPRCMKSPSPKTGDSAKGRGECGSSERSERSGRSGSPNGSSTTEHPTTKQAGVPEDPTGRGKLHYGMTCQFNLGPGSYATMALRELLRAPFDPPGGKARKCPRRIKWD
jgi:TruD family tRNA pseudouridine synthase